MFKGINTIIFDLEGVIIDTKDIWINTDRAFFSSKCIEYDISIKSKVVGKTLEEVVMYYKIVFNLKEDFEVLKNEYLGIVSLLFQEKVKYINGFKEFFDKVKDNFNVCIATSIDKTLLQVVCSHVELKKSFGEKIFSSSQYNLSGVDKVKIFDFAVKEMNSKYENSIVIEDSPLGLYSAKKLGIRCIALETNFCKDELKPHTDYIFKDLLDLINHL